MSPFTQTTGVGLRRTVVFMRDDDGAPKVLGNPEAGVSYAGVQARKARALTITIPEPQRITARGDDANYYTFQEAPTDNPSGELRTQQSDTELIELVTGVSDFGSGDNTMVALATDKVGLEEPLIIYGTRKAIDSKVGSSTFGGRAYETYFILNATASARPQGFETDQIGEFTWAITGNNSSSDFFGRTLTANTHGCSEAAFILVKTRYMPTLDVFIGDGEQTTFTLAHGANTIYNAPSTSPVMVAVNGEMTAFTISDQGVVTINPAPADGAKIVVFSEFSE